MTTHLGSLQDIINSATKYPSIPTYHALGDKGRLTDEINADFTGCEWQATEKIDGTNTRIIVPHPNLGLRDWFIGSREELLTASGDCIPNPTMGIVATVKPLACDLPTLDAFRFTHKGGLQVLYGETYGGKIQAGWYYAPSGRTDFRAFDIGWIPYERWRELLAMSVSEVAAWRDAGGMRWLSIPEDAGFRVAPVVATDVGGDLPTSLADTYEWLRAVLAGGTRVALVGETPANGYPEGVVVRTPDRSKIVKLRLEDYARTLRHKP